MAHWRLVPLAGGAALALRDNHTMVVGRSAACEIRLDDDTISRQHAELRAEADGVLVRDLGSVNGLKVNGVKMSHARLSADDVVCFGKLEFRLADADPEDVPAGTIVRPIDVRSGGGALGRLAAERLARLVELASALSGEIEIERLLATVVEQAAALLPVDRVALLLREDDGSLRLAHFSNRLGRAAVQVPQSIARRAMLERAPISTENALADARFQSGSVQSSQVRAALCAPLLADEQRVLGVLYVDTLTATTPFSESDAALCFALGGLAAVSIAKAHYAELARREALARANFERFFAPAVAERIAGQQSGVRPGGERRAVTVLYSDVRGFTGLAESLPPEAVARQLSEYFAAMVELVFEHGGTLDKFIGDALLAVWGAPLSAPDDADRAVAAARAMLRELAVLNTQWTATQRPALAIGIGLHHGEAFTGTIGSPRRLEYTVIGDVVNVAARLCDAAGVAEILLSEEVRARLRTPGEAWPAIPLTLRGREEGIVAYRIRESGQ